MANCQLTPRNLCKEQRRNADIYIRRKSSVPFSELLIHKWVTKLHPGRWGNQWSTFLVMLSGWLFTYRTLPVTHLVLQVHLVHVDSVINHFKSQGFSSHFWMEEQAEYLSRILTYRDSSENHVDDTNSDCCINRLADSSCLKNASGVVKDPIDSRKLLSHV